MAKKTQKKSQINTNNSAEEFLKMFRKNIILSAYKQSNNLSDQEEQEQKVQQLAHHDQMRSQSELEAEYLFGNLAPESPIISKKIKEQKLKKEINKTKVIKKTQSKSRKNNDQKINQTRSILLKGRINAEQQNQTKKIILNKSQESQEQNQVQMYQPKIEKKQRRVTFSGLLPLNSEIEKRWKDSIQNQKKGKFDAEETKILSQAVGQFLATNGISIEQFQLQLNSFERTEKFSRKNKIFALLSTALPNRSPQSCYKYLKRNFNSMNRKGKWTQEQVQKLKALIQKYGRKWTMISKQLKRTADNCYDKFRQLGQQNMQQRIKGFWRFRQLVELLKFVQKMTKIKFLHKDIQKQLQRQEEHDKREEQDVNSKKYNSKNFIFHNITVLKPFLDVKNFQRINISDIKWNQAALNLKTKNIFDCRNKIVQLLQVFFHLTPKQLDEDIIDFLIFHRYQNENEVNWKLWKGKEVTGEQAKNRFMIMKKMVEGRSIKPFKTVVLELKQKLSHKQKQAIKSEQKNKMILV